MSFETQLVVLGSQSDRIRLMPRGRVQVIRMQKGGSALFRMRGSFAAADIADEQIKQPVCSFRRCPFATAVFEYTPRRADQKRGSDSQSSHIQWL